MKLILLSIGLLSGLLAPGQARTAHGDSLAAERINAWKIRGTYVRYETLCSRKFKIKMGHRIKYRGGCEANKDRRRKGRWIIANDTLIVTGLFGEQQKWILVRGCFYNLDSFDHRAIACRAPFMREPK